MSFSVERLSRSIPVVPYHLRPPDHVLAVYGVASVVATYVLALNGFVSVVGSSSVFRPLSDWLLNKCSGLTEKFIPLIQAGMVPDFIIRWGIRLQLKNHLQLLASEDCETELRRKTAIVQTLRDMPIAVETKAANEQHYEVPAEFYSLCLGPCKKYSSGLWLTPRTTFEESELAMLDLYCQRAGVVDGMRIVDLGCGWGSLSLYLGARYPHCAITGISNSHSQREYILGQAKLRGLSNISIITCNVANDQGALDSVKGNDLVMTVEMFEHMKNYSSLLTKIHSFLKPSGKLFVHIFTHKTYCYHFEEGWMAENFFTGGTMPSDDLLMYFSNDFSILEHWRVNGTHYERTSNGWLNMLDASWKRGALQPVLEKAYGTGRAREWYVNWRLFFLACAELWGYDDGNEWIVSHYLFERRS